MTEYMLMAQAICAAGVLVLGILTLTGRITKTLREETDTKFNTIREEMRADRETLREEMRAEFNSVRGEMRADRETLREEMRSDRARIFGETKVLHEELHNMNVRLGRMEGRLGIAVPGSAGESE